MALKIAIPNKGRLTEDAVDLLRAAGIRVPHSIDRTLIANAGDGKYQILFTRAQDIPEFVEIGAADVGITGLDLVEETGSRVKRLLDLKFGRCKLVLAAPDHSRAASIEDLPHNARIATCYPNLTKRYFEKRRRAVTIVPISGAAEIAPYIGVADAITDLTQTGATLKQNHLTLLDVLLDSWAVLIAGPDGAARTRRHAGDLVDALRGVQEAASRRYLMANVARKRVADVVKIIPGLSAPTVMNLAKTGQVAVHAVVPEEALNDVIPKLKRAGATGILVLPIERMIP